MTNRRIWRPITALAVLLASMALGAVRGRPSVVLASNPEYYPASCSAPTPFEYGSLAVTMTSHGTAQFTFTWTINDPSGPRTLVTQETLQFGETAFPFFEATITTTSCSSKSRRALRSPRRRNGTTAQTSLAAGRLRDSAWYSL